MAQMKLFFACVLFLFTLCQNLECIKGRHLKLERKHTSSNLNKLNAEVLTKHEVVFVNDKLHVDADSGNKTVGAVVNATNTSLSSESPSGSPPVPPVGGNPRLSPPGRDVENFRPTAPGHSPGVGHSIHN